MIWYSYTVLKYITSVILFCILDPLDVDDWESDHEPCIVLPGLAHEAHQGAIDIVEEEHFVKDFLLERAEDWLIGEDPAMFSDEFSDPEEWGIH